MMADKSTDALQSNSSNSLFSGKLFVTIGNGKFDALIKEVDRLVSIGVLSGEVLCQIGHGGYEPKHCQWYRFKPSLEEDEKNADLVISHGGPGCVFELLLMGKKVIAIPNRNRTDVNHQVEFLHGLFEEGSRDKGSSTLGVHDRKSGYFIYCDYPSHLNKAFSQLAEGFIFSVYTQADCGLSFLVHSFIAQNVTRRRR